MAIAVSLADPLGWIIGSVFKSVFRVDCHMNEDIKRFSLNVIFNVELSKIQGVESKK